MIPQASSSATALEGFIAVLLSLITAQCTCYLVYKLAVFINPFGLYMSIFVYVRLCYDAICLTYWIILQRLQLCWLSHVALKAHS